MREKCYKCPVQECRQHYATRYNVRRHLSSAHPGFIPNECPRCQRVLSSRQNLRQHLAIHTGDRPYQCQFCLQYFRQSSQLSLHRKQHYMEAREMPVAKVCSRQLTQLLAQTGVSAELRDTEMLQKAISEGFRLPDLLKEPQTDTSHIATIW